MDYRHFQIFEEVAEDGSCSAWQSLDLWGVVHGSHRVFNCVQMMYDEFVR